MIKKLSILVAGFAIALPSAFAATSLSLSVQEAGFAPLTSTSSTGLVAIDNVNYDDFTLNTVTGIGTGVLSNPDLDLQTLNVTSPTLSSTHTLTIELTETGITGVANPFTFFNAFTGILVGVTSEKVSDYTDSSDTAFGTGHLVASWTNTSVGSNAFNLTASAPTGSPYSETEIIVASFGPTTNHPDTLNASAYMSSAVPEPASLALIGTGLLGLALVRSRRRSAKK